MGICSYYLLSLLWWLCKASINTCTPVQKASAIFLIWFGPVSCHVLFASNPECSAQSFIMGGKDLFCVDCKTCAKPSEVCQQICGYNCHTPEARTLLCESQNLCNIFQSMSSNLWAQQIPSQILSLGKNMWRTMNKTIFYFLGISNPKFRLCNHTRFNCVVNVIAKPFKYLNLWGRLCEHI